MFLERNYPNFVPIPSYFLSFFPSSSLLFSSSFLFFFLFQFLREHGKRLGGIKLPEWTSRPNGVGPRLIFQRLALQSVHNTRPRGVRTRGSGNQPPTTATSNTKILGKSCHAEATTPDGLIPRNRPLCAHARLLSLHSLAGTGDGDRCIKARITRRNLLKKLLEKFEAIIRI